MVPHLGSLVKMVLKGTDVVVKGLAEEAEQNSDIREVKQSISAALIAGGRRIIVILDDIIISDSDVRQVFQLVKVVADFANVIYLLAFDKVVVTKALDKVQDGAGERYLEKVVSVPIEVPPITAAQIYRLFDKRIQNFKLSHAAYRWDNGRLERVRKIVRYAFKTIRSLNRLSNILAFSEPLISYEVDYVDFLALCILQVLAPKLYYFIRDNPFLFLNLQVPAEHMEEGEGRETAAALLKQSGLLTANLDVMRRMSL